MKNLAVKEFKLFASPLTFFFLAFSLMTMLPGYPILLGAFFVSFGIFQSFQTGRETNDVLYTALLPISRRDAVKSKFLFALIVEGAAFFVMCALTAVRMTLLSGAKIYTSNALMNATPLFLAFALIIFAEFNAIFIVGFFRTAYKIGAPFFTFVAVVTATVFIGEALHFVPGLEFFNAPHGGRLSLQFLILAAAALMFAALTYAAYRVAAKRFEKVDL